MNVVPKATKWNHKKRGSHYVVIGEARFQCSTVMPKDGDFLTLYMSEEGTFSVRDPDEFLDGRFEEIK